MTPHVVDTLSDETVTIVKTRPWPWWQPHLYASAGTVVVMAMGWVLTVLTGHWH